MSLGDALALGCAFIWSLSIVLFKIAEENVDPVLLNLLKNTMAFVLMIPTILILGPEHWSPNVTGMDWALMIGSGLLGIGIADALILKCLKLIGPTRLAIVECLYAPCIITLSVLFLAESLTIFQFVGAGMVLFAVYLVN